MKYRQEGFSKARRACLHNARPLGRSFLHLLAQRNPNPEETDPCRLPSKGPFTLASSKCKHDGLLKVSVCFFNNFPTEINMGAPLCAPSSPVPNEILASSFPGSPLSYIPGGLPSTWQELSILSQLHTKALSSLCKLFELNKSLTKIFVPDPPLKR